jgi:Predicted membrane protein
MPSLLTAIVVSVCLGALVGLIRQWSDQKSSPTETDFGGVRTYTFWAMLGCVGAYASQLTSPFLLAAIFLVVGAQQIAAKLYTPNPNGHPGATTFASTLLTMLTGGLVFWDELPAAVLVAATTMVFLGSKQPLHAWTRSFTRNDVRATLQFVAITGVILPLVPDRDFGPYGAFNPYDTWLMVVLISGVGFAGYIAVRLLGAGAGLLLTSVLGGVASSTATTLTFARRSKEEPAQSLDYSMAVVTASTVMLPRTLAIVAVISPALAKALILPLAITALPGIAFIAWWWLARRRENQRAENNNSPALSNPLNLSTAIKFALLYAVIAFSVKVLTESGHTGGTLPLSFVSGLTDMAAIALSMARHAASDSLPLRLATHAVVLAAISNSLLKAGLAIGLGAPRLRKFSALVLGLTALAGAATLFL